MDDTLYPLSCGINLACRKNIQDFMLHHLQIEENQVPTMCLDLYKEHGTTMAGLKELGFEFDDNEFHAYVHGRLPYETLKPDPFLRNLLLTISHRKIVFTNADKAHAAKVLKRLALEDCFEGVICFETLNQPPPDSDTSKRIDSSKILCKPSLEAFQAAIRIANIDPKKTIFFDDSVRNIEAGKAAGFYTVLVGSSSGADVALESIHNLREALPEIWQDGEQVEPVIAQTAMEATVLA
ncbi:hypothetical protein Cni_G20536 [Canna indica]|uniref:Uncharacterized protein n=1 Tax=Canna indica TaxID=4628 RepID=A0AAQ3KMT8_9LILI|nr:hypothetical protein Cni_G20536 [Canna indica]